MHSTTHRSCQRFSTSKSLRSETLTDRPRAAAKLLSCLASRAEAPFCEPKRMVTSLRRPRLTAWDPCGSLVPHFCTTRTRRFGCQYCTSQDVAKLLLLCNWERCVRGSAGARGSAEHALSAPAGHRRKQCTPTALDLSGFYHLVQLACCPERVVGFCRRNIAATRRAQPKQPRRRCITQRLIDQTR